MRWREKKMEGERERKGEREWESERDSSIRGDR